MSQILIKNKNITLGEIRSENFLSHAFGDTPGYGQRKNHKYVMRIRDGRKWRYFYTMDEYERYMKKFRRKSSNQKYGDAVSTIEINDISDKDVAIIKAKYGIAKSKYDRAKRNYENIYKSSYASREEKDKARDEFLEASEAVSSLALVYQKVV